MRIITPFISFVEDPALVSPRLKKRDKNFHTTLSMGKEAVTESSSVRTSMRIKGKLEKRKKPRKAKETSGEVANDGKLRSFQKIANAQYKKRRRERKNLLQSLNRAVTSGRPIHVIVGEIESIRTKALDDGESTARTRFIMDAILENLYDYQSTLKCDILGVLCKSDSAFAKSFATDSDEGLARVWHDDLKILEFKVNIDMYGDSGEPIKDGIHWVDARFRLGGVRYKSSFPKCRVRNSRCAKSRHTTYREISDALNDLCYSSDHLREFVDSLDLSKYGGIVSVCRHCASGGASIDVLSEARIKCMDTRMEEDM